MAGRHRLQPLPLPALLAMVTVLALVAKPSAGRPGTQGDKPRSPAPPRPANPARRQSGASSASASTSSVQQGDASTPGPRLVVLATLEVALNATDAEKPKLQTRSLPGHIAATVLRLVVGFGLDVVTNVLESF